MKITCSVVCKSPDIFSECWKLAEERSQPDYAVATTMRTFPGGIEKQVVETYSMTDYFHSISLIPSNLSGFKMEFNVRQDVSSRWKFLIVNSLNRLSKAGAVVEIDRPRAEAIWE